MKTLPQPWPAPIDDAQEVLTLTEAGRRAGRSYSWARDRLIEGALVAAEPVRGSATVVTAKSLRALLASRRGRQHGGPRLAWTNPNR